MRKHYGAAFILLRIGACISAISPSLITVHQEVSENKLSENDSRETHEDETERLCRSEQKFPAIDPNVDEDSKLRVVGKMFLFWIRPKLIELELD